MAYGGPVHQSGCNHDPAQDSLCQEQDAHHDVQSYFAPGNGLPEDEDEERYGEDDAGQSGEEAVQPLDDEDLLVLIERHMGVYFLELGRELVFRELGLPGLLGERGHGATDGIPLDDGQAGTRKANEAAKDNQEYGE